MTPEYVVDFPTLGFLWSAWKRRHCRVPDRHQRGAPFVEYDWQRWVTANRGRIRPGVVHDPDRPLRNQAFVYRRHLVIAPQKTGKGPQTATDAALAACGPSEFCGWAAEGDYYSCADGGCPCGWEYEYLPGEPMGERHPSPLVQIMATSEDQVDNIWRPLVSMIHLGPLKKLLLPRENFIRVANLSDDPDMDRIDRITASALSRLGNPVTEGFLDESGTYLKANGLRKTAETIRRGAAGMGGRTTETTNPFDPAQESYAQASFESPRPDIFKFYRNPDVVPALRGKDGKPLSYLLKANRRKIHAYAYAGSDHVNLDSIEAEAADLIGTDPAQAERFFGNRIVAGGGAWLPEGLWSARRADVVAAA
ncbi:MAG: terminase [Actinomycetales bacterium]|jgi:hypothetical protein|uniref:Terminase n=1 Tax=Candidatus Phosphoribacter hodrii TaxID=2953743 RepID=A0A935IPE9_9MICO|nr:terminase [Candidatus Phosphoribacter hodrii]MBP9836058.1 hypothetical protein [Candidatus Microthrix sp.]